MYFLPGWTPTGEFAGSGSLLQILRSDGTNLYLEQDIRSDIIRAKHFEIDRAVAVEDRALKMISYGAKGFFLRRCSLIGLGELLEQVKTGPKAFNGNINGITVEWLDISKIL